MARLPVPGADENVWGDVLNTFLTVEHNADGTLKTSGTIAAKADTSTTIAAGTGLTGGGDLSTNRTISADFGTTVGTVAQGNDSRITGAIQSTSVDAKGDILVATAADTITRLGVGADNQVLTADSSQASGLRWAATPSVTDTNDAYPLSGYGFFAASENISACRDSGALDQAWFARVFIPAGKAINAISGFSAGAGTVGAGGLNGFAVYTDSGTLVTSTPDDNTMWQTAGWVIKVLGTPVAAQGSDRFVYIGIASRGYTSPPTIRYFTAPDGIINGGGYLVDKRRAFYNGISSWPASIDPQTYGNTAGGFLPLVTLG